MSDAPTKKVGGSVRDAFAERLRVYRKSKGYSQDSLASILDIKQQELSGLENGAAPITVEHLQRLREDGLDVERFLGGTATAEDPVLGALALFENLYTAGFVEAHPNRASALQRFREDIEQERAGISLFGSSLKGLLWDRETVNAIFKSLNQGARFRILITHPVFAPTRAYVEGRRAGAIESEIQEAMYSYTDRIKQLAGERVEVRVALHPPTIFLLALEGKRRALINPYTVTTEAYSTHSLIVRKTVDDNCLFTQYVENHFEKAWSSGDRLPEEPVSIALDRYEQPNKKELEDAGEKFFQALRAYAGQCSKQEVSSG